MSEVLPLEGLYLHLVRSGLPLSVRDYQDALAALRIGHAGYDRERLRWVCETLWCRTEEEVVALERLFRELPQPGTEVLRTMLGESAVEQPKTATVHDTAGEVIEAGKTSSEGRDEPEKAYVDFGRPSETGSGLPSVQLPVCDERFIMTPRPIVSLRTLIIVWRRFRRAQRSGPKVELDVEATVLEQGRRGRIAEPVLVPARRNQARVAVLVDASPSMAPWRSWNRILAESLRSSRFANAPLFYFDNVPGDVVYERDTLTRPIALGDVWRRQPPAALLVVSDAGAARGSVNRARIAATRTFVEASQEYWAPLAWINPMPRSRWASSTSGQIARLAGVRMFELSDDGLTAGIDFLRGKT